MIFKPGLRARIALSFALFSMLLVAAQTIAILIVTDDQEEEFINNILADEMWELMEIYRQAPQTAPPHAGDFSGYIVRNADERAALPPYLQNLAIGSHEIFIGDKEFHVEVRRQDGAEFYLLYDASRHEERIAKFRTFLLLGVFTMAAITIWLGYWLSGLLVRQVSDLAQRVVRRAPGEARPLAANYRDDEVLTLARAFDDYHLRMTRLLDREKEFTANLSHELRTPLTLIKTSCELLEQDENLQGKSRRRLENIQAAVDRTTELIQALLFLARETSLQENDDVNVKELAEEALEPFRERISGKGVALHVNIPDSASLRVHSPSLHLVLTNLIKNALEHTDRGAITVSYDGHNLSVADTGAGIADADLPHIFERFYRGRGALSPRDSTGLGLAIVKHVADHYGWRIGVESGPDRGCVFNLMFVK